MRSINLKNSCLVIKLRSTFDREFLANIFTHATAVGRVEFSASFVYFLSATILSGVTMV